MGLFSMEPKINLSEIFYSIQGEGPNTGKPSIFIRLAGCNLCCVWCDSILKGSMVLTEKYGYKRIEDIQIKDELLGVAKEIKHPVAQRYFYTKGKCGSINSHIEKQAIKIITDDGNEIITTLNHKLFAYYKFIKNNWTKQWQWIEAQNLKQGDTLWSIGSHTQEYCETLDYIDGWIHGYDCGDGGYSSDTKKNRRYESVDINITNRLEKYLKIKNIKYNRRIAPRKTTIGNTVYQLDSYYIPDKNQIEQKKSSEWNRGFVAGFYDAEGSTNCTNATICNKKISYIKLCEEILHNFNFQTKLSQGPGEMHYIECMGGVLERLRFDSIFQYSKNHRDKWLYKAKGWRGGTTSHRQAKIKTKIISIEKITGNFEFFDIGSTCENFICNGIVVHNSWYTWNWQGTDFKHNFAPKADPTKEIATYTVKDFINIFKTYAKKHKCSHIVITGGEPLIQQKALEKFFDIMRLEFGEYSGLVDFEIETNGTIIPSAELSKNIQYFSVSPKTSNSGNPIKLRERDKALVYFANNSKAIFKFVVDGEDDLEEIKYLENKYNISHKKIFLMPQGVTDEQIKIKGKWLVEVCKNKNYIYCHRIQSILWDAQRGV